MAVRRNVAKAVGLAVATCAGLLLAVTLFGSPSAAHASQERAADVSVSASLYGVNFHSAGIAASISGLPADGTAVLDYGPTAAYGSTGCCTTTVPAGSSTPGFSVFSGLQPNTTYHFRVEVTSGGTTYYSNDVVATTLATGPPGIRLYNPTNPADVFQPYGCWYAALEINTKGLDTTWYAAAGPDLAHPLTSPVQPIPAYDSDIWLNGGGMNLVLCMHDGVYDGEIVYLQLHASNSAGETLSPTYTYTIAIPPPTTTTTPTTTTSPFPTQKRPTMSSTSLPAGTIGKPYRTVLPLSNGTPPYIVTLNGPEAHMPPGLTLESNGVIDGTPTSEGQFSFDIGVYDQQFPQTVGFASVFTLTIPINRDAGTTSTVETTTTTPSSPTPKPRLVLPNRIRTPGVTNAVVTQATIKKTICASGWTAKIRPPVSYTNALKLKQMKRYGEKGSPTAYEEDQFIPLELGGAPRNPKNLWPEPKSQSKHSNPLETALKRKVCTGTLTLAAARRQIVVYKRRHG
jgi:hypothetical protein